MRPWLSVFAALFAAASLAIVSPTAAQTRIENPEGAWTHAPTGTVFPNNLGSAKRTSITVFDDAGNDAGVGYSITGETGGLTLTVYVYPAYPDLNCEEAFIDSHMAITRYPGTKLMAERQMPSPNGSKAASASFARYYVPAGAMKPDYPALLSDLYLYCPTGGQWMVKYRASWSGAPENMPDVQTMMKEIAWGAMLD